MTVPLPSRGLRGFAASILAGAVSGGLFAVAFSHAGTMLIFLAYFSAVPLFLVGLGTGVIGGAVAAAVAVAGLCLTKPLNFALLYTVIYALPATALIALTLYQKVSAERSPTWFPEGKLLTAVMLYPCVIFLAASAVTVGHQGGLLSVSLQMTSQAIEPFKAQLDADNAARFTATMNQVAQLLPAMLGCSWMFVILLSVVVAQTTLKQQNWNLRPGFVLTDLYIPNWLIFAAAATGLAGAFAPAPIDYTGANLCMMLCVPFFFAGLAVVHAWAATTKAKLAILILFYIIMAIIVWLVLLVTALGALDQWANFRRRLAVKKRGG